MMEKQEWEVTGDTGLPRGGAEEKAAGGSKGNAVAEQKNNKAFDGSIQNHPTNQGQHSSTVKKSKNRRRRENRRKRNRRAEEEQRKGAAELQSQENPSEFNYEDLHGENSRYAVSLGSTQLEYLKAKENKDAAIEIKPFKKLDNDPKENTSMSRRADLDPPSSLKAGNQQGLTKKQGFFNWVFGSSKSTSDEIQHFFHVCLQVPASIVEIIFVKEKQSIPVGNISMQCADKHGIYWKLQVPEHLGNYSFYYLMKSNSGVFQSQIYRRKEDRSSYTVFCFDKPYYNDYFTGPFHFAQSVFREFDEKKLTLMQSLQEYEEIRFGRTNMKPDDRIKVAQWIKCELEKKSTFEFAIFFSHVIQEFDKRLLYNLRNNYPLLKDCIGDDAKQRLLNLLVQCKKDTLHCLGEKVKRSVKEIVSFILCNLTGKRLIETLVKVCCQFGVDFLSTVHQSIESLRGNESMTRADLAAACSGISTLETENDRARLITFILKRSPSVSFLWTLYNYLKDVFPRYVASVQGLFQKTCKKILSSQQHNRRPLVLEVESWKTIPETFRPEISKHFMCVLQDCLKQVQRCLNTEEKEVIKTYFTDEVLMKHGEGTTIFFEICQVPEMCEVAIEILQLPGFAKYWIDLPENNKTKLYESIVNISFSLISKQEESQNKGRVVRMLEFMNDIYLSLKVCPCENIKETVKEQCDAFFNTEQLLSIAEQFDEIEKLHKDIVEYYFAVMHRAIDREVTKDQGHASILKLLKGLSNEDEENKQQHKCKWITEAILHSLSKQTKELNDTDALEQNGFQKVFEDVFVNESLWSAVLRVLPAGAEQKEFPQLFVLINAVKLFKTSVEEKTIKIRDLKKLKENPEHVKLLQQIHSLFVERSVITDKDPNLLVDLVNNCIKKESECFKTLEQLVDSLTSLKKIAKKIVVMIDIDGVLQDITSKKINHDDMSLRDVLDEDYWGRAQPYVSRLKKIRYLKYKVFNSAAQACLKEEYSSYHTRDSPLCFRLGIQKPSTCIEDVLRVVINKGIFHLKEKCRCLLTDAGTMAINDAKEVLRGITDLKEEIKFMQRHIFKFQEIAYNTELMLERFVRFPTILENAKVLQKLLESRGLSLPDGTNFAMKCLDDYTNLKELHEATEKVPYIEHLFSRSYGEIIKQLSESSELMELLEDTANDDVRNLIDAVEEHSDSTVAAKEVSDFIEIHRILSPVLKAESRKFLNVLQQRLLTLDENKATEVAARIKYISQNAHSLRNVYKNVANRGEMTKEVVHKAVNNGKYEINPKLKGDEGDHLLPREEVWDYNLLYSDQTDEEIFFGEEKEREKLTVHDMEKLQDLKSRALLIVNTERKQQSDPSENVSFQKFIKQIDVLNEIVMTGEELQRSGHPKYRNFYRECKESEEIQDICEELKKDQLTWEKTVRSARSSNFFLNFFHAKQLWILKEFFNGSNSVKNEAFSLLRFVDKSITIGEVTAFQNVCKPIPEDSYEQQFSQIAGNLENLFCSRSINCKRQTLEMDEERGLFVAALDQDSTKTASVVMKLFERSSPQPNRVLFCHSKSTWYEIELFLWRCFTEKLNNNSPYCIANVEILPTDLQFQLIDSIGEFQNFSKSNYWLVLICRGGDHHHIVNQFREFTMDVQYMTDAELQSTFSRLFPEVIMVTSDLPGLGKTESIHRRAAVSKKRLICFTVNGPVSRENLVDRLSTLGLGERSLLHIDISEVEEPLLVDNFLFELIVFGMVSSGTRLFHIPTKSIAIEIANTLQHSLRDSLTITKCFSHIHKKWNDFQDFVSSTENESSVQVVCHYLNAYEKRSLETDRLNLRDLKQAVPLSEQKCRELVAKHCTSRGDLSFNIVHCFLNVLSTQLRKFSASPFFRPENLKGALKDASDVRIKLFDALKNVSIDFATRSVGSCKEGQESAIFDNLYHFDSPSTSQQNQAADKMVDRIKGMIKWTDENHLVVMFQEAYSVSALFRELERVPSQVKLLFESQNDPLRDLEDLNEKELKEKLKRILFADTKNQSKDFDSHSYVLTPDNILKMVLIIQRIRAGVPVIVMGETGCGKTSLVRYLANSCGVPVAVLNFHAGIYEKDIMEFTQKQIEKAEKNFEKQVWVFFDEINTCDYLGLINDIICHRILNGKELPPNLVFIAACNPYCLRPTDGITTAGLTGKCSTDEYSNLVYRVKPLPETMMDYVWDYGSLDSKDERLYIKRMVDKLKRSDSQLVVDLLATSQAFIRQVEGNRYCVSLRDVRRCILLTEWFVKMLEERPRLNVTKLSPKVQEIYEEANSHTVKDRSIILALAHSYQSRIPSSKERKEYRKQLEKVYIKHSKSFSARELDVIIQAEQEEYLARMDLPDGTARNTALRENVFVILVCILNRLPVFVVGKPGCSKSLSMQVIRSNLRGKDSKDHFFKKLPQLLVVSYQGSESSTSEGIMKVFDKAQKYKKENESIPVVLLDEVGLAEISKYNPLKVLHRLLEPEDQELPDVAVVGISNWALDAAKMNRAIHLSRPEPTYEDLKETGLAILEAQLETIEGTSLQENAQQDVSKEMLSCLAESYFDYQKEQRLKNFHGLRDYYSLIKCLSRSLLTATKNTGNESSTFRALQRNFGGLTTRDHTIEDIYLEKSLSLQSEGICEKRKEFAITDLISDNLKDPSARHLMLITSGDSALPIIEKTLSDLDKEKVIIFGSKFEEDISEDYSYRILSRIILHMEQDCVLVLKDLESVYGSLYDMLNQNYVVVGKKKNCRVALGAYSNPMCQVHDGFRCIVLVDKENVNYADPPFLNRFEKQLLRYTDVLSKNEQAVITKLKCWTKDFCSIENKDFNERDVFLGFDKETIASLVLLLKQRDVPTSNLLRMCKNELMSIATPDGVLRSLRSDLYKRDAIDVKDFYESFFFHKTVHTGLKGFIEGCVNQAMQRQPEESTMEHQNIPNISFKYIVMTHSSIHSDVPGCLKGSLSCQIEKLGAFKSEKQLSKRIQKFWSSSDKELLIFQSKPNLDGEHMTLMKSTIEQQHESYLKTCKEEGKLPTKSICIIVHLQRGESTENSQWQFRFMRGWHQATLDSLEEPEVPINKLLGDSVSKLMDSKTLSLKDIIDDKLLWCFTRLKYPQHLSDTDSVNKEVAYLRSSETMMKYIEDIVLRWIRKHHDKKEGGEFWSSTLRACDWQLNVSCDKRSLLGSLTMSGAIQHYIDQLVRRPLAKVIYLIANRLTFESCHHALTESSSRTENEVFMAELIKDEDLFNIDDVPDPQESNCYVITQPEYPLNFPFSIIFCEKIGSLKEKYLRQCRNISLNDKSNHLSVDSQIEGQFFQELCSDIKQIVPQFFHYEWSNKNFYLYIEDMFDFISAQHSTKLPRKQRVAILKAACAETLISSTDRDLALLLARIHFFLWKYEINLLVIQQLYLVCPSIFDKMFEEQTKSYIDRFEKCLDDDGENEEDSGDDDDDEDDTYDSEDDISDVSDYSEDSEDSDDESKTEAEYHKENVNFLKTKPFLEMFFDALCKALIPTQDLILELDSPQNWQTTANSFISLAAKSSFGKSSLFSNLKVCCDFAAMILSPSKFQNPFSLYLLGELSQREEPSADLHNFFDEVIDVLENVETPTKMADDFKIEFLSRCLESCETEEAYKSILTRASFFSEKEVLERASPLIFRIIFYPIHFQEQHPFLAILEDSKEVSKEYPFFKEMKNVLNSTVEREKGVQDCCFAAICLYVIDQITCQDINFFSVSEVSASTSRTMICLRTAMMVVKEPRRLQNNLKLLTAVSYLRNSLSSIAELLHLKPFLLRKESEYSNLFMFLSSFLEVPKGTSTESPRKASCMLYFLRELRKNLSMYELRKLCEEAKMLPALKSLTWTDESRFPVTDLQDIKTKQEFNIALFKLIQLGDVSAMKGICDGLALNAKRRKAFAGALIEGLYLTLSFNSATDTMDKAMDSITELLPENVSPVYKDLVLCLTGRKDFKGTELRVTPESSLSSVRKATIVLHLLAILTAECSSLATLDRPFFSYLLNPYKPLRGYVLADSDNVNQKPKQRCHVLVCPCRTAFLRENDQTTCPQCFKLCTPLSTDIKTSLERKETSTVFLCIASTAGDEFSVKHMTASSFRLLHMLVVTTLYAGASVGTIPLKKLSPFMSLQEDQYNSVDKCLEEMDNDLKVLERLWGCNEEKVISTVHQLIEETSDIITKRIGSPHLTIEQREEWQKSFSDKVDQFFQNRQYDQRKEPLIDLSSLEAQIDEKDSTGDFDVQMRNSWLPRLFRFTKQKSLDDLRVKYYKAVDSKKKKHPLLGLFLQYIKILPLIGELHYLIKFSNMLEVHLGRRLSRKNSMKPVEDAIKEDSHKESLDKALKEFLSSWEIVRSLVENDLDGVPRLTEKSPVSHFLVHPGSDGKYLQKVIFELQKIQNEFQGKVLKLALEGSCPSLDFLKKSDSSSSMPIIHVQDIKKSDLICFKWDDNILVHSYHDTEYGKGREIHYDFGKIENELSERFLVGKVYLSTAGGLREFPFRNEMFHTCKNVLNDISDRLPQSPINDDQQKRLSLLLREERFQNVQDLLVDLEIIICWLSKTSYFDQQLVEMALLDYVQRKLPSSNLLQGERLKVSLKDFKLCHVVSTYQKLEELQADLTTKALHDKYRMPMPEKVLQVMNKGFGSTNQIELGIVVTTLRRFIFRYLLSDKDTLDPEGKAVKYFVDPSLWSIPDVLMSGGSNDECEGKIEDLIDKYLPNSMLICQVHSVLSFYDNIIKEMKNKEIRGKETSTILKKSRRKPTAKFQKMSTFA